MESESIPAELQLPRGDAIRLYRIVMELIRYLKPIVDALEAQAPTA